MGSKGRTEKPQVQESGRLSKVPHRTGRTRAEAFQSPCTNVEIGHRSLKVRIITVFEHVRHCNCDECHQKIGGQKILTNAPFSPLLSIPLLFLFSFTVPCYFSHRSLPLDDCYMRLA